MVWPSRQKMGSRFGKTKTPFNFSLLSFCPLSHAHVLLRDGQANGAESEHELVCKLQNRACTTRRINLQHKNKELNFEEVAGNKEGMSVTAVALLKRKPRWKETQSSRGFSSLDWSVERKFTCASWKELYSKLFRPWTFPIHPASC